MRPTTSRRWDVKLLDTLKQQARQWLSWNALLAVDLGEPDQAFECLEKAYQERESLLVYVRVTPNFDPIRADPRFHDLLRRMNLAG